VIDLFKDIGLPDERLHPKFLQLKKSMMEGQRKIVLSWTEGFIDRDNKIVEEFQRTFHSAFWELYLHQFFRDQGLKADYSKAQPDFIITSPVKFYVEAVTANIRQGAREESTRNAKTF
jgi:hypothetical protein